MLSPSALIPMQRAGAPGAGAPAGMSQANAATVALMALGVFLLTLADPKDACFLLAFPLWIVTRDLGLVAGATAAVISLAFVVVLGLAEDVMLGPFGYAARAAVFAGAVGAGTQAMLPEVATPPLPLLGLLTARPEISRPPEPLSRRELEILEMIATGAKNSEIAERFVISQNTVKSHVGQILKKLPAANRTEAAFRYIEVYGTPSPASGSAVPAEAPGTEKVSASAAVGATVAAVNGKDSLVLSLQDGRELELPLVEQLRERVAEGTQAIVYFDQHGREVGWYLPDEELGVDLRHWAH
jgi:DNA-binding CsgD family transcriptional regulator